MSRWRGMETAPRDGTFVLLWAPDYTNRPALGHWCERVGAWDSDAGTMEDGPGRKDLDECDGPILWHPLPDDPSEDAIANKAEGNG